MFNSLKLNTRFAAAALGALAIGATAFSAPATAAPQPLFPFFLPQFETAPPPVQAAPQDEEDRSVELPARLRRQVVSYPTREAPGTIIIDTPNTYLYLVIGNGQAMRTASESVATASPGQARRPSPARPNGRHGHRPRK
jgi:lipoprotein-anchoring transpeptidase ErfK/SrfK